MVYIFRDFCRRSKLRMKNKPSVSGANECQTSSNTTASSSISLPQSQLYIHKVPSSIRLHQQNNFRKKSTSSRRTSYIRKRESEWRKMAAAEEEEGFPSNLSLSLSFWQPIKRTANRSHGTLLISSAEERIDTRKGSTSEFAFLVVELTFSLFLALLKGRYGGWCVFIAWNLLELKKNRARSVDRTILEEIINVRSK